jgi:hypothetical protein
MRAAVIRVLQIAAAPPDRSKVFAAVGWRRVLQGNRLAAKSVYRNASVLALSLAVGLALHVGFILLRARLALLIAFTILAGLAGLTGVVLAALTHALPATLTGLPVFAGFALAGILLSLILAGILTLLAIHVGFLITSVRILFLLTARCFS